VLRAVTLAAPYPSSSRFHEPILRDHATAGSNDGRRASMVIGPYLLVPASYPEGRFNYLR
jgi:hypothetical protein